MAATTRATSPGATEPFPPLEPVPPALINTNTTTTSPASPSQPAAASTNNNNPTTTLLPTISEHSVFLRPPNTSELPPFSTSTTPAANTSPKTDKLTLLSPRRSPAALTGAAAMADAKRKRQQQQEPVSRETTPNPAVAAMQSLMGGGGISKPTDAPAPNKLSEPLRKAAEQIHIPADRSSTTSAQASPVSLSSFGTMDQTNGHGGALTATSAGSNDTLSRYVAEPAEMMDSANQTPSGVHHTSAEEDNSNKAFSYPGPPPSQQQQQQSNNHETGPARGMSLPGSNYQDSTKSSPAGKRYKCPYCSTDFTRHHNLKSHLLTHSQEKPYVCNTCQARFRRLHDLKRHTKLHTGERPHTCDKCGRRFARGDALARHNKGPGGCAGRRSSFGGDDDDADGMDGVEYTHDEDDDDTAGAPRRVSEPSRKRVHVETPNDPGRSVYRQHSSTYPPVQHRPGDMGPPAVVYPGNSNSTSPRDMTGPQGAMNSGYFQNHSHPSGGGMIESPKPLSPGQAPDGHRLSLDPNGTSSSMGRNRSPSLTTQFQQTHFGRGSISRTPPQPPAHMGQPNNQLPPLTLSTTSAGRTSLAGPGPSMLHHQQVPPHQAAVSGPSSASSHGQSSGSSMRDILGTGPGPLTTGGGDADIWSHLRQLEGKFVRMQDEYELRISRLQEEVMNLRSQLNNVQAAGNYPAEPRY